MTIIELIFWICIAIVFYSYIGYGFLLWILNKVIPFRRKNILPQNFEPEVTLITALYNEEEIVEEKIRNTFSINYPQHKLHLLFITDGSTDGTMEIIERYPRIKLMHRDGRSGKTAAINRAMESVKTPVVVFCDANTFLNPDCIKELVKHFADSKTGAVAGEKKIMASGEAAGAGEGIYWKYESALKQLDSRFYSVVGAAGELFAVRTELYEPVEKNVLLDDFIISMRICMKGYRVVYEPAAFALEAPSMNMREEQKRKIRISAGGIQSVLMLLPLLNIFRYGRLSFQYISHRVLRWIVCPPLLPLIFILNAFLVYKNAGKVYTIFFAAQCLFYLAAALGWVFARMNRKIKVLYIPYYFTFMNAAMFLGFKRFLNNSQSVIWDKATRSVHTPGKI